MNDIQREWGIGVVSLVGMTLIAAVACSDPEPSGEFFSLNDGSLDCTTILVRDQVTRQQLVDSLTVATLEAERTGCVNFQISHVAG